ncbi:hydroxymethylpyrimidine/phosphomethylpyrimidine kinase [Porifericola rhodea]|uniref:hydroxymethylpyrimidine/phosphomethylpyrimidine kinase n=1 Tax=Porifericola rhodea TaxID=930972 RepID=UPI002664EC12|nr:hydroxymethylpyrimidine/phosphomethylpyrimidine kinase [Porifericola rhodea]WKN32244.1 hydroxymethylpyrimidine/phosphomethylpyrimidine kinase [Porifericola rhodea]
MRKRRPYVLSIAGFDPSGGAGLLADSKTFEALEVTGLGVCSAITVQHESAFKNCQWVLLDTIKEQVDILFQQYPIRHCKIGLVESWDILQQLVSLLKQHQPDIRITLDPVLKASAGYNFHEDKQANTLHNLLEELYLLTPNTEEALRLQAEATAYEAAEFLSEHCYVLLKGGHNAEEPGVDHLYVSGIQVATLHASNSQVYPKHGSGCVLSSAITAYLALGFALPEACRRAKSYTESFLSSSKGLLGHHVPMTLT